MWAKGLFPRKLGLDLAGWLLVVCQPQQTKQHLLKRCLGGLSPWRALFWAAHSQTSDVPHPGQLALEVTKKIAPNTGSASQKTFKHTSVHKRPVPLKTGIGPGWLTSCGMPTPANNQYLLKRCLGGLSPWRALFWAAHSQTSDVPHPEQLAIEVHKGSRVEHGWCNRSICALVPWPTGPSFLGALELPGCKHTTCVCKLNAPIQNHIVF